MEKFPKFTNGVLSQIATRNPKGDLNMLGWRAIWFWGVASYLVLGWGLWVAGYLGLWVAGYLVLGGGGLFGFGGWRAIWF